MNFPKTLIFLIALNLTVATEFACAQTPAVPTARIPASTPAVAAASGRAASPSQRCRNHADRGHS